MDGALQIQGLGYRKIMQQSFRLYRKSFGKIFIFNLFISALVFLPRLMGSLGYTQLIDVAPFSSNHYILIGSYVLAIMLFIGVVWHVYCSFRDVKEPWFEDLQVGVKKLLSVIIAAIAETVFVCCITLAIYMFQIMLLQHDLLFQHDLSGILFTMLIFAGQFFVIIYVATLFIFFLPLIAVENKGILKAITKSASLVWNHWWRVFSVQITPLFCYTFLLLFIYSLIHMNVDLTFLGNQPVIPLWASLLHILILSCFIPWTASLMIVQLKDLEFRKAQAGEK